MEKREEFYVQIDMFMKEDIQTLNDKIEKVKRSTDSVRKGLFARNTGLEKYMTELRDKQEEQEREIYRLKKMIYEYFKSQETQLQEVG